VEVVEKILGFPGIFGSGKFLLGVGWRRQIIKLLANYYDLPNNRQFKLEGEESLRIFKEWRGFNSISTASFVMWIRFATFSSGVFLASKKSKTTIKSRFSS